MLVLSESGLADDGARLDARPIPCWVIRRPAFLLALVCFYWRLFVRIPLEVLFAAPFEEWQ